VRQLLEPFARRAWKPPSSSSIAEEERLVSLVLSTVARDFRRSQQFMEPLAHRAWKPPTSSSIAEEEHLVSPHARCSLRSLRLALVSR